MHCKTIPPKPDPALRWFLTEFTYDERKALIAARRGRLDDVTLGDMRAAQRARFADDESPTERMRRPPVTVRP